MEEEEKLFVTVQSQLISVQRMTGIENHYSANISLSCFHEGSVTDAKIHGLR